jgi:hypothetical protein
MRHRKRGGARPAPRRLRVAKILQDDAALLRDLFQLPHACLTRPPSGTNATTVAHTRALWVAIAAMGYHDLLNRNNPTSSLLGTTDGWLDLVAQVHLNGYDLGSGREVLKVYGYLCTHLIIYTSRWGRVRLDRQLYKHEWGFCWDVLAQLLRSSFDAELATEVVVALYILDYPDGVEHPPDHDVMMRKTMAKLTVCARRNRNRNKRVAAHEAFV